MIVPAGVPIALGVSLVLGAGALTAAVVLPAPPPPYHVWFDEPIPFGSLSEGENELLLHANFGNVTQFRVEVYDDNGLVGVLSSDGNDAEESFGPGAAVLTSDTVAWNADPGAYILVPAALRGSWKDSTPIVVTVQPGGGIEPGQDATVSAPTATPSSTPTPTATPTPTPKPTQGATAPPAPQPPAPVPTQAPAPQPTLPAPPAPVPPAPPSARLLFATGFADNRATFSVVDITPSTTSITVQIQIRSSSAGADWSQASIPVYCTPALDSYGRYRCTTPVYPVQTTTGYQYGYARLIATSNGAQLTPAPELTWTVQPRIG